MVSLRAVDAFVHRELLSRLTAAAHTRAAALGRLADHDAFVVSQVGVVMLHGALLETFWDHSDRVGGRAIHVYVH